MSKGLITLIVAGVLLGGTALASVGKFNSLVKLDERASGAHAVTNTSLQQRVDLLENMMNAARAYMTSEQATIIGYAQARTKTASTYPINPKTGQAATAAEMADDKELQKKHADNLAAATIATNQALTTMNVVKETVPNLQAAKLIEKYMNELKEMEKKIMAFRIIEQMVNKSYNQSIRTFPGNILANLTGFEKRPYFENEAGSNSAPKPAWTK